MKMSSTVAAGVDEPPRIHAGNFEKMKRRIDGRATGSAMSSSSSDGLIPVSSSTIACNHVKSLVVAATSSASAR